MQAAHGRHRAPTDCRVYAIGDIHGRADLLRALHRRIRADAAQAPGLDRRVVYLGDYIDRGAASREVLDILIDEPLPGFTSVHLSGNHEAMALDVLGDSRAAPRWLNDGGAATLKSYGLAGPPCWDPVAMADLGESLAAALPARHLAFLRGLRLSHSEGDYFFCHAGIRPGVALESQAREDLLRIRETFLESDADHSKMVVHGHSISDRVEPRPNRIGVDTGAWRSGRLSALVLEADTWRVLDTSDDD